MIEKSLLKIVITGGPCAGKTTALKCIREDLERAGFGVVAVPETATELICSGISPWTMDSKVNYQKYQLMLQLEKERLYCEAAKCLTAYEKIIVIIDRGGMDNKAYLSDEEFDGILCGLGMSEKDMLGRYDAVFHLETTAKGEGYTLSNNSARTETAEEAVYLDERIAKVWKKHAYYRAIKCADRFDVKVKALVNEIMKFVGE